MKEWIPVEGGSMSPFLLEGEGIAVDWTAAPASLKVGDVVLGRAADRSWIVHRVVDADGARVVTKGDAAFAVDDLVADAYWAKVVAVRTASRGERGFRAGALDRAIARVSRESLSSHRIHAAIARRTLRALARIRRALL